MTFANHQAQGVNMKGEGVCRDMAYWVWLYTGTSASLLVGCLYGLEPINLHA